MEVIKSSYPDGQDLPLSRVLTCDLHFDQEDILIKAEKTVLKDGAMPKCFYVFFSLYILYNFSEH